MVPPRVMVRHDKTLLSALSAAAVLAGCGDNSSPSIADAPVEAGVDAVIDAAYPDADESTQVQVTAYSRSRDGSVDPTATAIFVDVQGTLIKYGLVDANGVAFADMPAGGSVIVLQAMYSSVTSVRYVNITVVRAVAPGDRIAAGYRTPWLIPKAGSETTMQAGYTPPGAADPDLLTACGRDGDNGNPRTITFHASCVSTAFDVLAVGEDSSAVRQYVWLEDVPYAANGAFTIPNTWQPMPTTTTTFVDTPANLRALVASTSAVVDGQDFEMDRARVDQPTSDTLALPLVYAPTASPTMIWGRIFHDAGVYDDYTVVTAQPQSLTIDWSTLPVPRAAAVVTSPTGVTWTETGAGNADGRVVVWGSRWRGADNVERAAIYEILEPATGTLASTLPALPDVYASDDPTRATAATIIGAGVSYFDYDHLAGYDAARSYGPELAIVSVAFRSTPRRARMSYGFTGDL